MCYPRKIKSFPRPSDPFLLRETNVSAAFIQMSVARTLGTVTLAAI